jgi:hypothetical protein
MKKLTAVQMRDVETLRQSVVSLQHAFWDALFDLEQSLGVLIDETRDISDWSIEQIRSCAEDDVGPIAWQDSFASAKPPE